LTNSLPIEHILSPGHTIEIVFAHYIGITKSFPASIKAYENKNLLITTTDKETVNLLKPGAEITIQYKSEDGTEYLIGAYQVTDLHQQSLTLICAKPWKMPPSLLKRFLEPNVDTPWKINSASLRRYFRVKVNLPIYYNLHGVVYIGQVLDLSIGGLFAVIRPDSAFLLGSQFGFVLQFPDGKSLELQGKIVRSQTIENTRLGIGVEFANLNADHRDEIVQFLFTH
jgi:hypothetical protein